MHCQVDDYFSCKGITITAESTSATDCEHYIQKIDVINNPEYNRLLTVYRLPVFFKSANGFYKQGFVDNGR